MANYITERGGFKSMSFTSLVCLDNQCYLYISLRVAKFEHKRRAPIKFKRTCQMISYDGLMLAASYCTNKFSGAHKYIDY